MSHLSLEALARLVDEAPSPTEASHIAECGTCHAELEALRQQTTELATLPPLQPPERAWNDIETRLRREGLLRVAPPFWRAGTRALSMAAALTLFLAGGFAGYVYAGGLESTAPARHVATAPGQTPGTPEEAVQAVLAAEADYLDALQAYNSMAAGGAGTQDIVARLAALESIVLTTRAALSDAPTDPVINGYHFTALAQRDAMLQQIAASSETPWF